VVYEAGEHGVRVADPARGLVRIKRSEFERIWEQRAVLLLEPGAELHFAPTPHWFPWVLRHCRGAQGWLVQAVFLGLVYTALGLVTAFVVQRLVDDFIPGRQANRIITAGGVLLGLQLIRALVGYLRQRFLVGLGKRAATAIAHEFIGHLFSLPSRFFDTRKRGDIAARLQDASHVQGAVVQILGSTTVDVLVTALSLAVVFHFSPEMGWVALLLVPPYALLAGTVAARLHHEHHETLGAYGLLQASYIDTLGGIESLRRSGATVAFANATLALFGMFQSKVERLGFTQAAAVSKLEGVGGVFLTAVLTAGALLVLAGDLAIGAMFAAYSLAAGALPSLQRVTDGLFTLQAGSAAAQRLQDVLLTEPEPNPGANAFRMRRELRLEDVTFQWSPDEPLLQSTNLTLQRGKITGLSGANGSGKSTLIHLITRRYPLTEGTLTVDGMAAEAIDLHSYRRNVALVPEAVKIFNGTLGANLAMAAPDLPHETLLERLDEMSVESFLGRFKAGLATQLGEDGRRLSAGERQMIGLIRALLGDPSVLIVDEGFNALDHQAFSQAVRLVKAHARNGAVLLVSHVPQLISLADEHFNLERGAVLPDTPSRAA
jgi:ATP-binding cassette subfamily B protein